MSARGVTRNSLFLLGGGAAQIVRGLVVTPLVTRSLGVAGYGRYAAAFAVVSALQPIVGAGIAPILTREIVRRPEVERALVRAAVRGALAVALLLWAALAAAAWLWPAHIDRGTALWLGALLPGTAVGLAGASASARLRDGRVVLAQLAGNGVLIAGTLVALRHGGNAAAVAAATACGSLVQVAVTLLLVRGLPRGQAVAATVRLWRAAAPSIGTSLAVAACVALDIALVELLAGPAAAGAYAGASRLLLVALIVPQALASSLLPSFAAAPQASARLRNTILGMALVAFPVALAAPLYAPLVPLFLGRAFAAAVPLIPLLAWRTALMSVSTLADGWLLATGAQTRVLACHLATAATALALAFALVPALGARGAAIAVVAAELVKLTLLLAAIRQRASAALPLPLRSVA